MNNYKLEIQYNGKNYAGWQIQRNAVTVQQTIMDKIETLTKNRVNLIGSGRTDAGVHALGQVANFRTDVDLELDQFTYSLNSILPSDIAIISSEKVDESFHARFDAKKRAYIYLFTHIKSPFYNDFANYVKWLQNDHIKKLMEISKVLLGSHDFTSFTKKQAENENKICSIFDINWRRSKNLSIFYIQADRFLHGMVRAIVGTLLHAVSNDLDSKYLIDVLKAGSREAAAMSAPADGLFLYKVRY
jgi:tRNA pseudouridine38-40 synthase